MSISRKAMMCAPLVAVAIGLGAGAAQAVPKSGDPGGSPCTDQNGAKGTYIWSPSTNQWVCKIGGDAPQQKKAPPPASPFGS